MRRGSSRRQQGFPCCLLFGRWGIGGTTPHERRTAIAEAPRINDKIRAKELRLVAPDGSQIGIKNRDEALWLADQLGLDLVEVAPDAKPPVARLMDYGKHKYEQSLREREARKKQTRTVIKEVKFRPKIDDHDFAVKRRRIEMFLDEGDKVKVTMMFRGREVTHPELGRALLERLAREVEDYGEVELTPKLEGRNMTMLLIPNRKRRSRAKRQQAATEAASATDD